MIYSSLHLIRDVLQDTGVNIFLSSFLVKNSGNSLLSSFLWKSFNTYIIAGVEIVLSFICLKRNKFGRLGLFTILLAVFIFTLWLFYWFLL
ncbi:hypothetical protein COV53_04975 [Candidatus Gottesmanbacteria bacterium CG11_big_fil_rev_8_21_14_0_20_37_11]|uniref:Uncharacterized protein n=2 Tax=Candidatus Gottesmaniibacteriota TaxID=1752720 RepID=A0A1J4TQ75_9BACT|nr:MAG: hypothetical protein AUJ73_05210 [Candidatus Gottesmanbacteria bacterium CG1_02_37_22]PIR08059.1 MAG: hypothetical protein COV53_04975 [Candidatus Gottesmanbacteria bacterium CG11_big_fil_rev_8_21_14_0_20_37_11]